MKRPWLAYLLVALAACGAGIAITGLPSGGNSELLLLQPIDTTSTTSTPTTRPTAGTEPESTSTTVAATTTVATTTTAATTVATTIAPTTTIATTTTSTTTTAPTTTAASTTLPSTTSTTSAPLTPAETRVAVANGAGVPGIAGDAAELLTDAGFVDVAAVNSELVDVTTVYFVEGFEAMADLVAVELFIDPDAQADMSELPDLATDEEFDVVAVLGADIGS